MSTEPTMDFKDPRSPRKSFSGKPLKPALKKTGPPAGSSSTLGACRSVAQDTAKPPKRDMAASFLQFCAMCEKQIMTPSNSILYCSEACRRKDGAKPLSAATLHDLSPTSSVPSSPTRSILPARIPTGSYTDLPSVRIPPEIHDYRPDLDPTEWKPKLPARTQSEAFRYLSQFHRSTNSMSDTPNMSMNSDYFSGAIASLPNPGLASTPATTISTVSSLSTSAGYGNMNTVYNQHGLGSDFATRPLPTRHNRWYSVSGATPRGTDLVTPHIVPPVNSDLNELGASEIGEDLWGKKVIFRPSPDQGGMGALFGRK